MSDDPDFKAEYSKSSRASCKSCKVNIEKDVLRIAVMVQSPHFDGKQPNWFHYDCFWGRAKPTSASQFGGLDNLRWDDQKKIKDRLEGKIDGKKSKSAETFDYKDYNTEYAKTGKSKCRGCEDFIAKNQVRISRKDYTSQRAMQYGPLDSWYHVDCFIKERDALGFTSDRDITKIDQFPRLKSEDKEMMTEKFGKPTKAPKRKNEGSGDSKPSKVAKSDDSSEKAMKKQNDEYWKIRDQLESKISKDAIKGLLEYNNQELPSGDQNLLNRLADCMTFGALKKCPECENGQLVFSSTGYHCTGNLTEWTKCQFKTKDPKRGKFRIPDEYTDVDFLKKYKCNIQVRLFPEEVPEPECAAKCFGELKKIADKDKPFKGMKFAIIGKVTDKKALTQTIKDLGGETTSKIDSGISACFSTKEEFDSKSNAKKVKETQSHNIRVLNEEFLKDIKDDDFQGVVKKHSLSSWGDFSKSAPVKSALQLKSAARDAAMYTKSVPSTMKMTVKGGSAVDPESGLAKTYHVLKEGKDLYSEVLNVVDVMKGTNSYYKLQVLESDSGKFYQVFRSWGRVGTTIGGTKLEAFHSKDKAKDNFKSLFAEKTGNDWDDRANFKKQPHKFYPVDMDYGESSEIKSLNDAGSNSKLPKPIQDVIKLIFDVESMKKAMVEFEIDLKKMPLGKLSKSQVEKAYRVLTEVQDLLRNGGSETKFLDCSNRFYTLIPHDFGMEKPPLLNNEEILKTKTDMLDSLLEIEIAYSLMKSTDSSAQDPIDHHYEQLHTEMEVLDKSSDEFKRIVEYVKNTHGVTHDITMEVDEILTVKRHKEASRYKPFRKLHNRMLLWHGSRITNYAGILSQGLRIAPPEAPVTGYMFGKGVYFADMASKSANYCRTTRSNPTALMLLCEVACGTMYEREHAENVRKLPDGYHSTKGVGRTEPDKSGFYTSPDGVIYPMGKGANSGPSSTSLLYNEYIVYDTAQINMKYLLRMKIKPSY